MTDNTTDFSDCPVCHRAVMSKVTPKGIHYPMSHRGPCGLPCFGGMVDPMHVRAKQVHGSNIVPCPRCTEEPKT